MSTHLPEIPGIRLLSEIRATLFGRWYRVDSPRPELIVLFHDAQAGELAAREASGWNHSELPGIATIIESSRLNGLPWFRLSTDTGYDPLAAQPFGELGAVALLRQVAAALNELPTAHGALLQGGLTLLPGPSIEILPPFLTDDWLAERLDAPLRSDVPNGYLSLSAPARDLSALATLACRWICGVGLTTAAGGGAIPSELAHKASPATVQTVRVLLKEVANDPTAAEAQALLGRIGWARKGRSAAAAVAPLGVARRSSPQAPRVAPAESSSSGRRRPPRPEEGAPARSKGAGDDRGTDRPIPRSVRTKRIPAMVGIGLVVLLGGGLLALGGAGAIKEFFGGMEQVAVPEQADPMTAKLADDASLPETPVEPLMGAEEVRGEDDATRSEGSTSSDSTSESVADRIVRELAEKRANQNKPKVAKKPSTDRSAITAGNERKEAAIEILRAVRDHEVKKEDHNRRLEEAIGLLENARDEYLKFIEQYPDKEYLVEGTLSDVTALLKMAYKSKTRA